MPIRVPAVGAAGAALAVLLAAGALVAGPLAPPPGTVASTYKTLAEVEPRIPISATTTLGDADSVFKITQPGSYYLTGNVTAPNGKAAIEITSGGVTIDLSGFTVQGVTGATYGLRSTATGSGVSVRNGTIRGFAWSGIDFVTAGEITSVTLDNLHVSGNTQVGIEVGSSSVVRGCTSSSNGNSGFYVGSGVVENCSAEHNGAQGIAVAIAGTVRSCTASDNANTGISVGHSSVVTGCSVYNNDGYGISGASYTLVESCAVRSNGNGGITVNNACIIRDNLCTANGDAAFEAGIDCVATDNRVEGNSCVSNSCGIRLGVGGNFMIKNSCAGNTLNWSLAANNVFGPIVDRTLPASAGVSGNSAASSLASTDPNANYTY
jgi:hypothetical protein